MGRSHICNCSDGMMSEKTSATANVNSLGRVYEGSLGIAAPEVVATTSPNPFVDNSTSPISFG